MSFSPEPGIHIRAKIKIVLDLSNYATKKRIRSCYSRRYI